MMHIQEIKERRPHPAGDDEDAQETETDPMVPDVASPRRPHPESWLRFVLDRVWSMAFLSVAVLGLYEADFFPQLLRAPHAHRGFVHLGVFFASLLGLFGCYIELYRGVVRGERVHYESAKTATHGMLVSMLASGVW
jgi:hypothetical protein